MNCSRSPGKHQVGLRQDPNGKSGVSDTETDSDPVTNIRRSGLSSPTFVCAFLQLVKERKKKKNLGFGMSH